MIIVGLGFIIAWLVFGLICKTVKAIVFFGVIGFIFYLLISILHSWLVWWMLAVFIVSFVVENEKRKRKIK